MTTKAALAGNSWARTTVALLAACCMQLSLAQEGDTEAEPDQPRAVESVVVKSAPDSEVWQQRLTVFIDRKFAFEQDSGDADDLFRQLDLVLHSRVHRINEQMRNATSPLHAVNLERDLPADIESIADLHENIDKLYEVRLLLLEHLSDDLRLEVMATDIIGMEQLALEIEYIWQQIHFRALNLPAAVDNLARRIQIAPIPVIWHFIQFMLVVAAIRWWRKWFPETLRRMQSSLGDIRPRSPAVMRRIRFIWYVEQVRRPLEWLLFATVLFMMMRLEGLNLMLSITESIVRWILLGWLAVCVLTAFSARGAAGLTGADAKVRLRSLQLVAAWLVLLGLGLDLAADLAGVATLHAWVWRLFQILALPVLLVLLAWWRKPIFTRLERESEYSEAVQEMLRHQSGLRSFGSAANGAFWLLANNVRLWMMRTFVRVGDGHGLSLTGASNGSATDAAVDTHAGVDDAIRAQLLAGSSGFDKHARTERRRLIRRANSAESGIVAVVGERGIGKSAMLSDVSAALEDKALSLECNSGQHVEVERALCDALAVDSMTPEAISGALQSRDIRLVAIQNVHRLSRPIIGGQAELKKLSDLVEAIDHKVLWVFSVDCFAWQFLRRARADQSSIHEVVDVPSWSEEQLSALIQQRNESAGIEPDFSKAQVPAEYAVTSFDTAEERNEAGIYRMLWTISGGNPAVALLSWSDCLYFESEDDTQVYVQVPVQQSVRDLDSAAHNVMLVLRCIAQAELITEDDVVDNLRLPQGAVGSAMHHCISQGWINVVEGRYRISMRWFRTITRALARQNLLAR